MSDALPPFITLFVYACIGLSILTSLLKSRSTSPQLAIANRWLRWLGISLGAAFICYEAGWFSRPFWSLAFIFFLIWLLLETVYTWLAIRALSMSTFALFPRFRENSSGEEWPASKKMIGLRDWLKEQGFSKAQSLVSDIGNGVLIRSSVYQDPSNKIRAQVLFVPQSNGSIGYCFSFSSETEGGVRIITDNLFMPYGGFYPENWEVRRKPWQRSISRIFKLHQKRIQKLDLLSFEISPLEELNHQQQLLELTNIDAGFLFPPHLQEDEGRITWEGRYRVWKEVWLLNYFGISSKS